MTESLCSYALSALAKKKGYDWPCRHLWVENAGKTKWIPPPKDEDYIKLFQGTVIKWKTNLPGLLEDLKKMELQPLHNSGLQDNICTRPTLDLLIKWFRVQHGILVGITPVYKEGILKGWLSPGPLTITNALPDYGNTTLYVEYDDAVEAALQQAFELL